MKTTPAKVWRLRTANPEVWSLACAPARKRWLTTPVPQTHAGRAPHTWLAALARR
jgi:hypothetical protein